MKPLHELKPHARHVIGVLTDIDDTLTTQSKLSLEAYAALQALRDAGLKIIPITGGAASLALHAARLWPVDAAIGESGALAYHHDGGRIQTHFWDEQATRTAQGLKRDAMIALLQRDVPNAKLASDQCFRLCDLAINLTEDLPIAERLNMEEIMQLHALLRSHGFTTRQSSIHINAWLGNYDKLPMTQRVLQQLWGIDVQHADQRQRWVYVGDAPNDEAMFEFFPLSLGVANIASHLPHMKHGPAFISTRSHGAGFAEIVHTLLSAR